MNDYSHDWQAGRTVAQLRRRDRLTACRYWIRAAVCAALLVTLYVCNKLGG